MEPRKCFVFFISMYLKYRDPLLHFIQQLHSSTSRHIWWCSIDNLLLHILLLYWDTQSSLIVERPHRVILLTCNRQSLATYSTVACLSTNSTHTLTIARLFCHHGINVNFLISSAVEHWNQVTYRNGRRGKRHLVCW